LVPIAPGVWGKGMGTQYLNQSSELSEMAQAVFKE
jgi:hypothetical protein